MLSRQAEKRPIASKISPQSSPRSFRWRHQKYDRAVIEADYRILWQFARQLSRAQRNIPTDQQHPGGKINLSQGFGQIWAETSNKIAQAQTRSKCCFRNQVNWPGHRLNADGAQRLYSHALYQNRENKQISSRIQRTKWSGPQCLGTSYDLNGEGF